MNAPAILERLSACGVRLERAGAALVATPRAALTSELLTLIRDHKPELLDALAGHTDPEAGHFEQAEARPEPVPFPGSQARMGRALAYLEAHPNVRRACFADVDSDPANIVLTVALRDPWGAVEVLVSLAKFDALALLELANRYPATSLQIPEH